MLLLNLQGHTCKVKLSFPHVHIGCFCNSGLILAGVLDISTFTLLKFVSSLLMLIYVQFISVKVTKKPVIH